jgi:multidrug efflux pump subunit AcrA (membrane-fusion protein)
MVKLEAVVTRRTKLILGISGVLLLVGITVFAVTQLGGGSTSSEPLPQYTTVAVEQGDVSRTVNAPGELVLTETKTIQSPATEELVELLVEPGDEVVEGQRLAQFDTENLESGVDEAYQAYLDAHDIYNDTNWEDAEEQAAAYERMFDAWEAYQRVLEDVDEMTVYAPCEGTVLDVQAYVGDIVPAFNALIILADMSNLCMLVTVDQYDVGSIKPGNSAEIYLDAITGTVFEGEVDYVVPWSESSGTPTYEVYISIDEVLEDCFPSMTGDATIVVAEEADVLRVPRGLVRIAADGSGRVEVLVAGEPVMRTVEIGLQGDYYYEIVSGLSRGDLLVQWGR